MALSSTEIQRKSDEKRGLKTKSLKFHLSTIALLEQLAEQTGKPQAAIIAEALAQYAANISQ